MTNRTSRPNFNRRSHLFCFPRHTRPRFSWHWHRQWKTETSAEIRVSQILRKSLQVPDSQYSAADTVKSTQNSPLRENSLQKGRTSNEMHTSISWQVGQVKSKKHKMDSEVWKGETNWILCIITGLIFIIFLKTMHVKPEPDCQCSR